MEQSFKNVARDISIIIQGYPLVPRIVDAIAQHGGKALLVGGAVRDLLLGLPIKDLDIEVHGLEGKQLEDILRSFGPVSLVGKAFGVLRLHGLDVDWSLPRTDAAGRKPTVTIDPFMGYTESFRRRDLTMNAMGIDLVTGELIDPFHGQEDLKNKILRTPDAKLFVEDPLRFYRVMHFIGRFSMQPDAELNAICKAMDISQVSRERIEVEFEKLLLRSPQPSLGIRWLHALGRLPQILPELAATVGCEQNPQWHPEGDVFEHSMQAFDSAARIPCDDHKTKLILLYAALCHDLGKPVSSQITDGRITSHGHAQAGALLVPRMLKRITHNQDVISAVRKLVHYHMAPLEFSQGNAKAAAYRRLAHKLAPEVTIELLCKLSYADRQGRNPVGNVPLTGDIPEIDAFKHKAQECQVLHSAQEPILQGRDLMDLVPPGPAMGRLLKKAYQIQLDEGIVDKQELKKRVMK